ncbi:TetR family transcriptional regulator [Limibacter armeniacum]|uniref:TetR/AcrR family transcriptional regulator n=1 Tax=Limibacter armeniacum TaxID=466084 RepID=UPI002FE5AC1B
MKGQKDIEKDNTELKIRLAAKELFTAKGFKGTTVRDVAKKADVNIALVNYYFRSKEKLFKAIFEENTKEYFLLIQDIVQSEGLTLEERIKRYVSTVMDQLVQNPQLPMFILQEMHQNPELFLDKKRMDCTRIAQSLLTRHKDEISPEKLSNIDVIQLEASISSLIVFPLVSKVIMMKVHDLDEAEYHNLMEQRKEIITDMIISYLKS